MLGQALTMRKLLAELDFPLPKHVQTPVLLFSAQGLKFYFLKTEVKVCFFLVPGN